MRPDYNRKTARNSLNRKFQKRFPIHIWLQIHRTVHHNNHIRKSNIIQIGQGTKFHQPGWLVQLEQCTRKNCPQRIKPICKRQESHYTLCHTQFMHYTGICVFGKERPITKNGLDRKINRHPASIAAHYFRQMQTAIVYNKNIPHERRMQRDNRYAKRFGLAQQTKINQIPCIYNNSKLQIGR